ncbi:Hsp20/alpha crystallin family protein [Phenylobacterium sp.]|uniref:Hsp20/alpha crystallin family protein n=1 Tax=Phenylobacterium sp. TaxID=1871053 RepID=UPI0035B3E62E
MTAQPPVNQFLPTLQRSAANVFGPIHREFDRLFDQLGAGWSTLAELEPVPRMDVRDTDEGLEVTVELPGLKESDVTVSVEDNLLTVAGEKKTQKETKEGGYRLAERTFGAFSRTITLPGGVDAAKIKAVMADGVLTLTAPRSAAAKAKTIKIEPAK